MQELQQLPQAQQDRIAESIAATVQSDLDTRPAILRDPQPLLLHKGRPTTVETRKRALSIADDANSKRIPSSWEKHEKKARKCGYCGRRGTGHDARNCPQKRS
jgi:hypothetical protein